MRRAGSQSMYQPNNKSVAVSKVMGSSAIGGLQGKSMVNNSMRKVQGHDLARTTKTNFEQTVNNLKNKPNQKVLEDQYINGLQEEIKYLEYELKLLKDKEILEREGVNQLDNFLKDQIPINENILAMKNKYNATKTKLEQQLSSLTLKKGEANDILKSQKNEIERLHMIIDAHRKQKEDRRSQFKSKLGQIVKEMSLTVDEYTFLSQDNKRINEAIKKMNEEVSAIQRQIEKEKVAEVRLTEEKIKKGQKFQQKYKANREDMIETTQKCQQLLELEDKNPLIDPSQQQNRGLRKKIMLIQKQKSTADNNIIQIMLFLNEQERDREIQRQHKNKHLIAGDQYRHQIQYLDRETDSIVKDQTLRAKKIIIKDMNNQLTQKEDVYDLMTDRLRGLEQQCSKLIQDKKEMMDSLEDQNKLEKELLQLIDNTEETMTACRSNAASLTRITQEIGQQILPVQDQLQKCKGRIPMVQRQIQRKSTNIDYLNKQIDLLKQLKSLDLQQLQLISTGGSQVQNLLHSFIKSWEKIKTQ